VSDDVRLSGARVLVTGAAGFIGSHLVEALVEAGAEVRAFVRYTSRASLGALQYVPASVIDRVQVVFGDLRDESAARNAADGCDLIFHLAASISIPYSYLHPREVIETNVLGTLNVLEAARQSRPLRIVHASTSEVYGTALETPMREDHPLQAQSPYAASKIGADKVVQSYARSFDLPVVTVRPFNTYGPRQTPRAVIPTIILQVLAGGDIQLGSLTPKRDFTFVTDTVRGFLRAAVASDVIGREIHLGTGEAVSVADLCRRILELWGAGERSVVSNEALVRPERSEVFNLISDPSLAERLLDWRVSVPLSEGLAGTIEWFREHSASYAVIRNA
jgi:NAD dependent epimerase/dehydratase